MFKLKNLLILSFLLFSSCTYEGIIINKWYESATFYNVVKPIYNNGKYIYLPTLEYDDEDWCILIQRTNKRDKRIEISLDEYNTLNIGGKYEYKK